jgi:hypothetical protein
MKKYIPVVLVALLAGAQNSAVAQPSHDHSQHAAQADVVDMTPMREEMQKKMSSAKTDVERQKIMSEQQKKMQGMHDQMHSQKGDHDHGHMKNMPADGDMQKRRQQMQEQMSK